MPTLPRALLALAIILSGASAQAQTLTPFENPQPPPAPVKKQPVKKAPLRKAPLKKEPLKKTGVYHHPGPRAQVPVIPPPRHGVPPRHPLRPTASAPTLVKPPPPKAAAASPPPPPPAPKKPEAPPLPANVGTDSHLPLPRFAALKTDEVNMRAGPGEQYPVLWQYQRRDLPVKIEREFDKWRLVEDMDGIKGWMHEATLTGHREFVVTGTADVNLRAQANEASDAVAILKPGVIGRLRACDAASGWCQVQVQSYQGFVRRSDVWGVLEGEVIGP